MQPTDAELLERTVAGDMAAFAELYRRRWELVYRSVIKRGHTEDVALDATSSAFLKLLENSIAGTFRPTRASLAEYLCTAARNAAIDEVRRSKKVRPTDEPPGSDKVMPAPDTSYSVEELLALFRAYLSLRSEDKDLIESRVIRGIPPRSLATTEEIGSVATRKTVSRAKKRLCLSYADHRAADLDTPPCDFSGEVLAALLNELSEPQRASVDRHVRDCRSCARLRTEFEELPSRLRVIGLPLLLGIRRGGFDVRLTAAGSATGHPAPEPPEPLTPPTPPPPAAGPVLEQVGTSPRASRSVKVLAGSTALLMILGIWVAEIRRSPDTTSAEQALQPTAAPGPPVQTSTSVPVTAPPAAGAAGPRTVATARSTTVPVFDGPASPSPALTLENPSANGLEQVFYVRSTLGDRLEVLLPYSPERKTGWIRTADVTLTTHDFSIRVEVSARRLTAWKGSLIFHQEGVLVGSTASPTPLGLAFIAAVIERPQNDPRCPQTVIPLVFVLSDYSDAVPRPCYQVAIFGSDDPSLRGQDSTRGSVRISTEGMVKLAGMLPLGVPVEIVP